MEDLERAREFFGHDLYATEASGITIEAVGENYSKCEMILTERHRNARGRVMGGAIFTLADFAFAVATNSPEAWTVSLHSTISYLNMPKGEKLIAESHCLKNGRQTTVHEITIRDENGKDIADVIITGMHVSNI